MNYKYEDLVVISKELLDNLGSLKRLAKPLLPIVESAFDAGGAYAIGSHKDFQQIHPNKQEFITKGIDL